MESTIITDGSRLLAVASTVSSSVSLSSSTSPDPSPSRSARSLTWSGDSSPVTYSADPPRSFTRAATCSRIVDLPIPGSPPTSTMDPGTIPPPSTKSNSSMPVLSRCASEPTTWLSRVVATTVPPAPNDPAPPTRRALPPPLAARTLGAAVSSTSVSHSPQTSHRPAHFGWSAPHSVQRYTVLTFGVTMPSSRRGLAGGVVLEPRVVLVEEQIHGADGTVTLLQHDDLRPPFE